MKTIQGENFKASCDLSQNQAQIEGTLRLRGINEYEDISNMLNDLLKENSAISIDVSKLEFLNSSGIAMLSRFIIKARKIEGLSVTMQSSKDIPWQGKSLKNLQRLLPSLEIVEC